MTAAIVTSDGQVTIPAEIRQQFGIEAGDQLVFTSENGSLHVQVLKRRSVTEFRGILPATRPYPGMDAIREETGRVLGEELLRKLNRNEADAHA